MSPVKTLKVLHLIHSLEMGGAQKVMAYLVKHHDRSKYIPIVGSLRRAGPLEGLMRNAGADVVYFDKKSTLDLGCALRLRRYILRNGITIVNAHNFSASFWGRIACIGLRDVGFVVTEHGRTGTPPFKVILFNRLFAGGIDAIIAVGGETGEFLQTRYPYNAYKIRMVVNGIDIPTEPGWTKEKLQSEFGIPAQSPVVVNLAALTPVKDQGLLIKAIARVREKMPEIRLLLIGDGPMRDGLENLVDELNLADNVTFTGERIDGPRILAACDIFCLSSKVEGTPMAILEAMAYSCPIVATAVGGIPGIIRDGEEGLLVPHGDIEALSGALERILNNGGMARKLAVNASLRLASDFSAQEMTHRTEEVYGEMLSRMRSGER